jgi:hypothetical protein
MSVFLLDVNVLIALIDSNHVFIMTAPMRGLLQKA